MSKPSRPAHDARERTSGRYAKSPPCDGCGKPVGTGYFTDDEVCGGGDGPGFYLCERKRCRARLQSIGIENRRRLYTEQRAANEDRVKPRRPMGYRAVVEWLALNDDHDPKTAEEVGALVTTTLAADIFRRTPEEVGGDVLAYRAVIARGES